MPATSGELDAEDRLDRSGGIGDRHGSDSTTASAGTVTCE